MAVSREVLGMNARNFLYIRKYNNSKAKRIADDKIRTKRLLLKNSIPTPSRIVLFKKRNNIINFNWDLSPQGFVVKPARGYGGAGILVFKSWKNGNGKLISGEVYSRGDLESHLFDILDGAYSLQFLPDKGFIEERVIADPFFKKLAPFGLADIRIVVFNHIPVMAMLRLPTRESQGKANLHLGAVGVGIDLRTGSTVRAVHRDKLIENTPDTNIKLRGIKIPNWEKILLLAVNTQSVCGLGFAGIDIVVDDKRGPLVLEINARPGLSIQNANLASLRTRLERIEDMPTPTPIRGVEVAKSLFADSAADNIDNGSSVLSVVETVMLKHNGVSKEVKCKIDTGAYRSSLDLKLASELDLPISSRKIKVSAASGSQIRPVVKTSFTLAGKKITTVATITSRSHLRYPIIIGRKDLKGFLVNPILLEEQDEDEDNGKKGRTY